MTSENNEHRQVGLESLRYHPSKVSWAMSQHISRENPKIHRILVYVIVLMIILTVFYSLFTKVAISLKASGKLDFEASTLTVVNSNDLVVEKIFFKNNDTVKQRDLLITAKKQLSLESAKELNIDAQTLSTYIEMEKEGRCAVNCLKKLENFSSNGFSKKKDLNVEGELTDYLRQINTDLNAYVLALKNRGNEGSTLSGLQLRLSQAKSKLSQIQRKNAQNLLAMEVENLNKEIADINSQINEKKLGSSNQITSARSALVLNLGPMKEKLLNYRRNHELRAPADGILKYESIGGEGELITARSKVFQIIPTSANLIAKIYVQNKDISDIAVNHKVKITIQALPEREYGSVEGVIRKIAVTPTENKETGTLNYEVLVDLKQQTLTSTFGQEKEFKLGMLLDAKIITKHKTLFLVGISKLLNIKTEYLGELF